MTTVGEFLANGADDMWQRVTSDKTWDALDNAYWTEEQRLIRDAMRVLRRCDDELTYRLTGQRLRPPRFYDQERIKAEQQRAGEYQTIADREQARFVETLAPGFSDAFRETSLAESEVEAEQRRFNERNQ